MSGTQWTRHLWCFIAITNDCELLQPIFGEQPWLIWACLSPPLTRLCCVRHPCPCWWLLWAEAQLKLSIHLAFPRKCFSSGLRLLKSSCLWVVPTVHCSSSSLAVELGGLGSLPRALCPGRLSLIPLPRAIHHCVSSEPSLSPSWGSQSKEWDIQGKEEQVYVSWCHSLRGASFRVHDPWWGPTPHTLWGAGVAQHQAFAQTGLSSWLFLPWLPLALARLRKCIHWICHLEVTCCFVCLGYLSHLLLFY